MAFTAQIGAIEFEFERARGGQLKEMNAEPFVALADGTLVRRFEHRGRPYLVIDHRRDAGARAHVERWRAVDAAEGARPTLLVLCDAA